MRANPRWAAMTAYKEGYAAYQANPNAVNPYTKGTRQAQVWTYGRDVAAYEATRKTPCTCGLSAKPAHEQYDNRCDCICGRV